MSKEKSKRQLSISVDDDLVTRLDEWIKWQADKRGYKVDRSHIVNVLLRRFLEKNDAFIQDQKNSLDID